MLHQPGARPTPVQPSDPKLADLPNTVEHEAHLEHLWREHLKAMETGDDLRLRNRRKVR